MNMRNTLLGVLIIILVAGAVWYFAGKTSTEPPPGYRLPFTLTEEGRSREYIEETDLYVIRATYPNVPHQAAMVAVEEVVMEEIAEFKSEIVSLIDETEAARIREAGRPYQLTVDYKEFFTEKLSSFEFDVYLDTGGAHPNGFFRTLTLDEEAQKVALADLFEPGAQYLNRLSEEAHERVLAELATRTALSQGEVTSEMEDTVRIGTSPTPETLQHFYVTDEALHLLFPPYQVAAYAAGSFDIAIPWEELVEIARADIR